MTPSDPELCEDSLAEPSGNQRGGRHESLRLVPIDQATAKDCVTRWHRHNVAPPGALFQVGVEDAAGVLVAAGIAGRPVARLYDDGETVEITRVSSDGTRNATSMLYAALTRAAFALGYRRVITYTQADESGASLRAAGWRVVAARPPRPRGWNMPSRPRDDARYTVSARQLWEASP